MSKEPSQEWDDIHFGLEEPPAPLDPNAPPVDEIPDRAFADEDELESSAGKPKDEDDDLPFIPPVADPNAPEPPEPEPPVSENMSGIEMYLAQFDIEDGMIQFDDGAVHFNDLDAAKQAEVLQQLHATQAVSVESKYGLDEDEIGLVNYLRENKLTVDQMVDQLVAERVATMMTMQELATEDYEKMEADAIYMKFLKETSPEATPEQIAADLLKAKELSNFTKQTEALRAQYTAKQKELVEAKSSESKVNHDALVETQRKEIVQAVLPMTEIAGITLDQNIKNTVLDHILETNAEGDSKFMDEVFAGPESLFKAAFWYVYGESMIAQRDEYWKKEKSAAYKRGKEDALGTSGQPAGRSFMTKPVDKTPHTGRTTPANESDEEDWSALHNN